MGGITGMATYGMNFHPFGGDIVNGCGESSYQPNAIQTIGNKLANSAMTGGVYGGSYAAATGQNIEKGITKGAMYWAAGEAANMAIGHGLGYAMSGGSPTLKGGAFYYLADGQQPFTVGGAIIGDEEWLSGHYSLDGKIYSVDNHERSHFPQQRALSVAYIPAHLVSQGVSYVASGFTSTHRYNLLERSLIDVPNY